MIREWGVDKVADYIVFANSALDLLFFINYRLHPNHKWESRIIDVERPYGVAALLSDKQLGNAPGDADQAAEVRNVWRRFIRALVI